MVVVVNVPDRKGLGLLGLRGPCPGVEEFLGQDSVLALDLPAVAWSVGGDALVAASLEDVGKVGGPVAGAVVGDNPRSILVIPWAGKNALARFTNPMAVLASSLGKASLRRPGGVCPPTAECKYTYLPRLGPVGGLALRALAAMDAAAAAADAADLLHVTCTVCPGRRGWILRGSLFFSQFGR